MLFIKERIGAGMAELHSTSETEGAGMEELHLTPEAEGIRVDKFLALEISGLTRSHIQKLISMGLVTVDGRKVKANYKTSLGREIVLVIPMPKEPDILPENIPLDILYEDDDLLIVNKPKGMVVHPAPGHYTKTLVNAVMYHCSDRLSGINGILRPGIVHRIDMDTTGSLVICKNDTAHQALAEQLKTHEIKRTYQAVVHGNIRDNEGLVDAPIGRHPKDRKKMSVQSAKGRRAVTHYKVLERFGDFTYIECSLETGRTHQIRVHMASIGHPITGDTVYGPAKCPFKLQGQALHAKVLGFTHPSKGVYMEFEAPLPEYFVKLLNRLRNSEK